MGHEDEHDAQDRTGDDDGGFDAAIEAAWSRFRVRLADRVDETETGGAVSLFAPELSQRIGRRPGLGILVAVDDVLTLGIDVHEGHREERLPRDQVDRAAARAVQVLRDELVVLHPSMLLAEGLEHDPAAPLPRTGQGEDPAAGEGGPADPADRVTTPHDRDHLQELVDDALGRMLGEVRHDAEGDVPIRDGRSVCWVSVREDRPVVELFAELVHDPTDPDAVRREVALLNEEHDSFKFVARGSAVVMRLEVLALPFCESHLVVAARLFTSVMDDVARRLVERVGGSRFLDDPEEPEEAEATEPAPVDPVAAAAPAAPGPTVLDLGGLEVAGLVELLVLGPVRPATVAGLFGHDRHQIIRQLVLLRSGSAGAAGLREHAEGAGLDLELVLTALRQALRLVSDGPRPGTGDVARRRRSIQSPLVAEVDPGEDTLDLGWAT
ncbi:T3SS (YopN, CesT) and YbjN peptide-binding chaperone 1 [Nocardioides sp. AX2bis]|uniref:T3SS (YopN, CesT) and YbjN peptide-binding chaperone 1 n=1 Tax=Nocardioides sp. AX2bis TaxID=2653157 RepID=UPI0012F42798|nr:hypothetical protein [Nocardioides sp. AX2bis]VXC09591.1 conserved hypothetical protein [Nocardioides sp. AX2bis]